MDFVDRREELKALDRFYRRESGGLLILYGRRRVGKTLLLDHWLETRQITTQNALFWTASTYSTVTQLRDLTPLLLAFAPDFARVVGAAYIFPDWEAVFNFIADVAAKATVPLIIIFDEFTNAIRNEPEMTSTLQKVWDHRLSRLPKLRFILTGSLVSIIKKEVLSNQAPLYGRATSIMRLRPLPYGALTQIYPEWPRDARLAAYAVCGGVPAYLDLLRQGRTFEEGLTEYALTAGSIMMTDQLLILNEQLRDTFTYSSILSTIASGFHDWGGIAKMVKLEKTSLSGYVDMLEALELVEQRRPVLSAPNERKSRYHVSDPFLRFYYRFIVPHTTAIMRGQTGLMMQTLREQLRAYIGLYVFEEICREWVVFQADKDTLGFRPDVGEIGSYWTSAKESGVALDVVAANSQAERLFIGECKWGEGDVSRRILTDLVERSKKMPQVAKGWRVDYALFARSGFTSATQVLAQELGVRLIDLDEIEDALAEGV